MKPYTKHIGFAVLQYETVLSIWVKEMIDYWKMPLKSSSQLSHEFVTTISWVCHNYLMSLSQLSHEFDTTISWVCHNYLMSLSQLSHEFVTTISWVCHNYLMSLQLRRPVYNVSKFPCRWMTTGIACFTRPLQSNSSWLQSFAIVQDV